jgi:hypothetical protein
MQRYSLKSTVFSSCIHGLERVLGKNRSPEEWNKTMKIMAGKPHADISEADLKKIEKWIDFYQSAIKASP